MVQRKEISTRQLAGSAVRLLLIALVAVSAVSYAWFTISDNTRVNMLRMDVTTGKSIRIDVRAHESFEDYKPSLDFSEIRDHVLASGGPDYNSILLEPVTSSDGVSFAFEKGERVTAGDFVFIEYVLHFMAQDDVLLHITERSSKAGGDGSLIYSEREPAAARAMRMSFTAEGEAPVIYDPRGGANYAVLGEATKICALPADTDVAVTVRIWLEGNDPECLNHLKGADYGIRLRFEASDSDFGPLA